MSFFDRYSNLCKTHNPPYDPCGRQIAQLIGINNSTATTWKQNGTTPKGDTIRNIADLFNVSADYLLNRTEDQTDHTRQPQILSDTEKRLLQMFRQMDTAVAEDCLRYCEFALMKQEDNRKKASEAG